MDEDPMERLGLPDEPGFERRIVEPGADDFAALAAQGHWKVRLEEVRIGPVSRKEQIRYARVHPSVEDTVFAYEFVGSALRAFRERGRVLPRSVVLSWRRRERLAALLAIPERDLRVIEPTPGDRPVDRQAFRPVEEQLPMPQRTEFHLVREPLQILTEFELLQIPRVRGDELDRVQGPRADRRLVLNRLDLVEGAADPELVDRLLAGSVDFQAFQEAGRLGHPACLVDGLERIETQLAKHGEVDHVPVRADHRGPAPEFGLRARMRDDGHLVTVEGHACLLALQRAVSLIAGMDHHGTTGREEFGSGCRDLDLATRGKGELHPNEARRPVLVLDVRLGEGRFAYGTPEGRAFSAVEEALGPQL